MGLFSSHKKLCPFCGEPTPRILPTKVEGMPICKACDAKIDLPDGTIDTMTVDKLRQYFAFYEANAPLREKFTESYRFTFGFLSGALVLDVPHRLLRVREGEERLVFDAGCLRSFRILEDNKPLFEGTRSALRCHTSTVPERVNALAPQLNQYILQLQEYEHYDRMRRMREEERRGAGRDVPPPPTGQFRPQLEVPLPFRKFVVEIQFAHPYWGSVTWQLDAPGFDNDRPSISDYLERYRKNTEELHTLARNLMSILLPGAPELKDGQAMPAAKTRATAAPVKSAAPAVGTADELKKYKELLDAGALTEEEFTAAKRRLLGL